MPQCPRDTRCVKEKGHKGWCKVTGEREWEEPPKRSSRGGGAAASKVAKMQALGAKRERKAARQASYLQLGEESSSKMWSRVPSSTVRSARSKT